MNSGVGDTNALKEFGIKTVRHLPSVGQNLTDHSIITNFWQVNAKDSETYDLMERNATVASDFLDQWQTKRSGPLVDGIFNTVAFVRLPPDAQIFKQFPNQDPSPGPNTAHVELIPMVSC